MWDCGDLGRKCTWCSESKGRHGSVEASAPTVEASAPTVEASAPTVEASAPTVEASAPTVEDTSFCLQCTAV